MAQGYGYYYTTQEQGHPPGVASPPSFSRGPTSAKDASSLYSTGSRSSISTAISQRLSSISKGSTNFLNRSSNHGHDHDHDPPPLPSKKLLNLFKRTTPSSSTPPSPSSNGKSSISSFIPRLATSSSSLPNLHPSSGLPSPPTTPDQFGQIMPGRRLYPGSGARDTKGSSKAERVLGIEFGDRAPKGLDSKVAKLLGFDEVVPEPRRGGDVGGGTGAMRGTGQGEMEITNRYGKRSES